MRKMLELDRRIHLLARKPPVEQLADAFNEFILSKERQQNKTQRRPRIEDFHAALLLQTFVSIEEAESGEDSKSGRSMLTSRDLDRALRMLATNEENLTSVHNTLARRINNALSRSKDQTSTQQDRMDGMRLLRLTSILARTGDITEARERLEQFSKRSSEGDKQLVSSAWTEILKGCVKGDDQQQLDRTIAVMRELSIPWRANSRSVVALHFARQNDISRTKEWFTSEIWRPDDPSAEASEEVFADNEVYRSLLEFCIRNHELEWGHSLLKAIKLETPTLRTWDAAFQASASAGRGVDEIDRMVGTMMNQGRNGMTFPDIFIFNGLIQQALSKNDPYTAERYFGLIHRWKAIPDSLTYILQVKYRLAAKDYDGALASYSKLRELPVFNDEDWPVVNKLVQELASTPTIQPDQIMSIVGDLSKKQRIFPADTVGALCMYHLAREEYFETVDLLQTYAYQYSVSQRVWLRDLLLSVALNPSSSTSKIWDTYMIFHQVFDLETNRLPRTQIMSVMYARGRPDLATHVFTRMAKHARIDSRPDRDTYVAAFQGIAQSQDPDSLEVVHNRLKLDTETEPDTRMLNSLMLANVSCGATSKALDIWERIAMSDEGPSLESLHIVFRACEDDEYGLETAEAIWNKLDSNDIDIERKLFANYVGVLAGNNMSDQAMRLTEHMPRIVGETPGILV
ncbi:MAG: hypothetical protein M1828_006829 [Chrysothrix sp. TS-e1954]|nr:MAG: hypothetical protein M1828_006829 [Chrysothrix sp. TS-e1954]